jgi:secondary thiamine-phosphate synthase enzyme
MKLHQQAVRVSTRGRGLHDVTRAVQAAVDGASVTTGLCTVFVQHTSASLVIQENADPAVLRDLEGWMARTAPEDAAAYEHADEGIDDMPAHLRASVTRTSETIPVSGGRLAFGTWQALYLWEHRRAPHTRSLLVHVQGE